MYPFDIPRTPIDRRTAIATFGKGEKQMSGTDLVLLYVRLGEEERDKEAKRASRELERQAAARRKEERELAEFRRRKDPWRYSQKKGPITTEMVIEEKPTPVFGQWD